MGRLPGAESTLKFLRTVGRLKLLKRSGWLLHGLSPASTESVADHTFRASVTALVLAPPERAGRVAKMALVHDLAESYVGDITPLDGVTPLEKYQRERAALHEMVRDLPHEVGREIIELWEEFEAGVSVDATLVRDIDKLELIMQADEYEQRGAHEGLDLQPFFDGTNGNFRTSTVRKIVDELNAQRHSRRAEVKAEVAEPDSVNTSPRAVKAVATGGPTVAAVAEDK